VLRARDLSPQQHTFGTRASGRCLETEHPKISASWSAAARVGIVRSIDSIE
jgi:hypothetical protein